MSQEKSQEEENEEDWSLKDSEIDLRPRIFEGECQDTLPDGFDTVLIEIDGGLKSDLDWKKEREQALRAIDKGYFLMWNLELGLFQNLCKPISCESQFFSLTLALEHFRDTLWKEFRQNTVGLSLYRGSADFSERFHWDDLQEANFKKWLKDFGFHSKCSLNYLEMIQESRGKELVTLFCRDVALEYISLLSSRLPDPLAVYLFLDIEGIRNWHSAFELQMLNPERFDRLTLGLKGSHLPFESIGWKNPSPWGYSGVNPIELPEEKIPLIGVCIPSMQFVHSRHYRPLAKTIEILKERSIRFKLIAERELTSRWDGLDFLLYDPASLSAQGKRMLLGFCAAGGQVISSSGIGGFNHEISFEEAMLQLSSVIK